MEAPREVMKGSTDVLTVLLIMCSGLQVHMDHLCRKAYDTIHRLLFLEVWYDLARLAADTRISYLPRGSILLKVHT
jgi:hypothetical protein